MLNKGQIKNIVKVIQSKQIKSFLLEEELIDFVSCAVQDRVSAGTGFEKALEDVLKEIEAQEISKIHRITSNSFKPNSIDMLQNYFKIAVRNFVKHRANSVVNVLGLLLALSSVLIIGLYVNNEFTYDTSFPDAHRIYRVNGTSYMGDVPSSSNYVSPLLVDAMLEEIPEVQFAASGLVASPSKPITIADQNYFDIKIDYFKQDVFEIFGMKVKSGSLESAYAQPYGLMVSDVFAKRIFGDKSPLNQTMETEIRGKKTVFTIYGIFEHVSEQTHFQASWNRMEVIGSQETWEIIQGGKGQWNSTHMPAYVKLVEDADPAEVDQKLDELLKRRAGEGVFYSHYLQPVWDIHLNTRGLPTASNGDLTQVITFGLIGILILVIACINYVNLATARVTIRMKEVGVRKVLGAGRKQFLFQFIVEAFIVTVVSLLISIGLVSISLEFLNTKFDLNLSISLFESGKLIIGLFTILFLVSVISGGYPGLYLSKMSSINLLKSSLKVGNAKISVRKILVVFQFGISAAIIICTIVVINQLNFLRQSDLGYDQESIVYIPIPGREIKSKGTIFKQALSNLPVVKSLALSSGSLAKGNFSGNSIRIGVDGEWSMQRIVPVDFDYAETMGIELSEGRWFDAEMVTDVEQGFVVNEAFLRYFDLSNPIGQKISRNDQDGEIIGVAKDFHWKSMHNEIGPLVMFMQKDYAQRYGNIVVKLNPGNLGQTVDQMEEAWASIFGERPFEVQFLDAQLQEIYRQDKVFGDIFSSFSFIAIIISCLGLLGLVSFSVERRLKEIGVRKVLGASISSILVLISKDFSKLVLVGFILSIPAAYYFIESWLANFEYRVELNYWPFMIACFLTILIAWASVSFVSLRAAKANPVDSLRAE